MEILASIILVIGIFSFPLAAITSPLIIQYTKKQYSLELIEKAKRLNFVTVFVLLVLIPYVFGISLESRAANITIVIFSMLGCGLLALFSFKLKPKWFGIVVGLLSTVSGFFLVICLLMDLALKDTSPQIVEIENAMYCKKSFYGFVTTDSGVNYEVFKRYLFIDKLLTSYQFSETTPENNNWQDTTDDQIFSRCRDVFNKMPYTTTTKTL